MGYFSNGTEAQMYIEDWCVNCHHWKDKNDGREYGCPVWDLHLLYVGEKKQQPLLDELIPRSKDKIGNLRCTMFVDLRFRKRVPRNQTSLFKEK